MEKDSITETSIWAVFKNWCANLCFFSAVFRCCCCCLFCFVLFLRSTQADAGSTLPNRFFFRVSDDWISELTLAKTNRGWFYGRDHEAMILLSPAQEQYYFFILYSSRSQSCGSVAVTTVTTAGLQVLETGEPADEGKQPWLAAQHQSGISWLCL